MKSKVLPNKGSISRNSTYNMLARLIGLSLFILLLPVYLVLGLLIWMFEGLPIFFVQQRVGKGGRIFKMYKFRSMIRGADKLQKDYRNSNEADGPVFKIHDDPRLTKIGKFIFHTGLDELPQLLNIVLGDMELIGPRPLPADEECQIDKRIRDIRRSVRPGIVSPWIFDGYHKLKFNEWMRCDANYVKRKSISFDLALTLKGLFFLIKLIFVEVFDILTGNKRGD